MIHYNLRQVAVFLATDVLCIVIALYLGELLRTQVDFGLEGPVSAFQTPRWLFVLAPLLWLAALYMSQIYVLRRNLTSTQRISNLIVGQLGATLLFWGLLYIGFRDYSRLQSFYVIGFSFLLLLGYRLIAHALAERIGRDAYQATRILIIGRDQAAEQLADAVATGQSSQIRFVGFVDSEASASDRADEQMPVLGTLDQLSQLIREHHVTDLVISLKWFDQDAVALIGRILREVENTNVDVRVAPDYSDVAYFQASSDMFAGVPLITIRAPILTAGQRFLKRLLDIAFAGTALLLCLPLFIVIAIAIRLDTPGPVLLRQQRIGYRGRPFFMYKFRSMLHTGSGAPPAGSPYNLRKLKDDPRITRVGRVLRRTSLDELPQFINVLKGDMSIVGPRPEVPWMVEQYEWWQRKRFEVPQGMTGWWQINGRADRPMYFHTSDDLYYIRNYSLWLDFRIIVRTIVVVILGRGAY